MCGRLSLFAALDALEERFDATAAADVAYEPRYNVAPQQELLTVPDADEGTITTQQWGLLAPWADGPEDGPRHINARAETVAEKPTFRDAFAEQRRPAERSEARPGTRANGVSEAGRCLVLSDGFYEWKGDRGHKQPYRICLSDDAPFAFAGLWNRWEGESESFETVTIVTTQANEAVEPIHDRMPVILERGEERGWLRADADDALDLLEPYSADDLRTYPVSKRVNDSANDDPAVLAEVAGQEQTGLDRFIGG